VVDKSATRETQQVQEGLDTVVGVLNYWDEVVKSFSGIQDARRSSQPQRTEMPQDDYRRLPWLEALDWFAAHCQATERLWTKQ
jgi:hypothetical protein